MKGVLVVAAREIAERKRIFVAAAIASLLPFLAPLVPDVARGSAAGIRGFVALLFLAAFGIGTAAVLGSAVLARDLTERRTGFYFSRPLSSLSIWGGKVLGAFLLAAGSALICVLPAGIAAPRSGLIDPSLAPTGMWSVAGLFLCGLLLLIAFSHAGTVALRSRSPWLAVDVVLLVVCALVITGSVLRLYRAGYRIPGLAAGVAAIVTLLLLLAAGATSTAAGRTDLNRVHLIQSLVIWGTLMPLSLAGAGYVHWLLSPTLSELTSVIGGSVSPRGDWLVVEGYARGRGPVPAGFLMKTDSSASLRIPAAVYWFSWDATFSPDGRFAYGFRREAQKPDLWRLWRAGLDAARPEVVDTGITSGTPPEVRISPSGRLVGLLAEQTLSVVDLASETTVAAVRLQDGESGRTYVFSDDETIRIFRWTSPARNRSTEPLPVLEFRIREKRLHEAGAVPRFGPRVPSGRVAPEVKGLRPFGPLGGFSDAALPASAGQQGPRTRWYLDEKGALLRVDPSTGERTQILPNPK